MTYLLGSIRVGVECLRSRKPRILARFAAIAVDLYVLWLWCMDVGSGWRIGHARSLVPCILGALPVPIHELAEGILSAIAAFAGLLLARRALTTRFRDPGNVP